jgi:membrane-bound metal-dependent hydrolase YbcI (DUF457 family)
MRTSALDFYDYPWSHSLVALAGWGVLFAVIHFTRRRDAGAAILLFACVISHWFLDVLMHRPDVPVFPGGPRVGLGLWNSAAATLLVEGAVYVGGIALYVRATRPKDRAGMWSLWLLAGLLAALWIGGMFGPPPPNSRSLAIVGAVMGWLIILPWGYWIDRHRTVRVGVN